MNDDIVKELRESRIALHSTAHKAADEIEKMREELDACDEKIKELCDEITRLRADLAAVTAERDRMREVIKGINAMLEISCETLERPTYDSLEVGQRHNPLSQKEIIQRLTETCLFVRADLSKLMDEARAALEGVTEPASPWRDIESAPRDGTWIFIYKDSWHGAIKAKWDSIDGVDSPFMAWVFQDEFLCIGCAEGCLGYNEDIEDGYMPTHWMPLPEPPR